MLYFIYHLLFSNYFKDLSPADLRTVSVERWCRLRGNLLFYFKSRDQWSEPAGVLVLEGVTVTAPPTDPCPAPPHQVSLWSCSAR